RRLFFTTHLLCFITSMTTVHHTSSLLSLIMVHSGSCVAQLGMPPAVRDQLPQPWTAAVLTRSEIRLRSQRSRQNASCGNPSTWTYNT
ncbi:hypothetical protein EV401DRAFT_1940052, partial [Pisolithus croceorrhizus]